MKTQNHTLCKVLLSLMLFLVFLSCTKTTNRTTPKASPISIMTTINPYYLMVKQIVMDKIAVALFIPANSSPHTFSPVPADIIKLEQASLVVANGLGLEQPITSKLDSLRNKVFIAAACLPVLIPDTGEDVDEHQGQNPHIWLDPQNLVLIAAALKERIIKLMPDNKDFFEQNWQILDNSIKQTDHDILAERQLFQAPAIVTFHNSFMYFLQRYNIELAAVISQSPGKEPTAKELMTIGSQVSRVKVIFIEPQLNPRAAKVIASEYNLQIETLDPLGFFFKAQNIGDILWQNWNTMKNSFLL